MPFSFDKIIKKRAKNIAYAGTLGEIEKSSKYLYNQKKVQIFVDKLNISTIEDITVSRVKSDNGPVGAKQAFDKLESRMPDLKGRKMYGVIYPKTNEYFACVMLDKERPDDMGFERSTIPGGSYAKKKIKDWSSKIQKIGAEFQALKEACIEKGYKIDKIRPSIEFYRSFTELIIMIPVEV